MSTDHGSLKAAKSARLLPFFEAAIVLPTLAGLTLAITGAERADVQDVLFQLVVWVVIIALVELIPVPVWRGVHVSMGFPLMMVVAFLYPPQAAAARMPRSRPTRSRSSASRRSRSPNTTP